MAKKPKQPTVNDDFGSFFTFARKLWSNGDLLRAIREDMKLSKTEFAARMGITTAKLRGYERSGQMAGNFWLFCHDLQHTKIDPRHWDDPDYLDRFSYVPSDPMGGPDNRHGKPDKFWRWAEDAKKEEMSRRTGKPIPHDDVERWHKEWQDLGKPDGWGRQMSKPID